MKHANAAEFLLERGMEIMKPRDRIMLAESVVDKATNEVLIARMKIALDFAKRSPALHLDAMVGGWSMERIKREMY